MTGHLEALDSFRIGNSQVARKKKDWLKVGAFKVIFCMSLSQGWNVQPCPPDLWAREKD
jgi:hypothetical protein